MKAVRSHLRLLLAQKAMREGRTISLREVVRQAGIPISTVMGLANNSIKQVPIDALASLCEYLDCELCELLRLEESPSQEEPDQRIPIAEQHSLGL